MDLSIAFDQLSFAVVLRPSYGLETVSDDLAIAPASDHLFP
jgi:hypothetical protein